MVPFYFFTLVGTLSAASTCEDLADKVFHSAHPSYRAVFVSVLCDGSSQAAPAECADIALKTDGITHSYEDVVLLCRGAVKPLLPIQCFQVGLEDDEVTHRYQSLSVLCSGATSKSAPIRCFKKSNQDENPDIGFFPEISHACSNNKQDFLGLAYLKLGNESYGPKFLGAVNSFKKNE